MYDLDYFIKKFEAIPEDRWNDHTQYDEHNSTCCAFGHCATDLEEMNGAETPEGRALGNIFREAGFTTWNNLWVTDVNNGRSDKYKQQTPKQRMLAALKDIKQLLAAREAEGD